MDLLAAHASALRQFDRRVDAVRPGDWDRPTPDSEWTVRDLVGHLTGEQLWVPELLAGRTVDQVGDAFAGDVLGADPKAAWRAASTAARDAWTGPAAVEETVHLSAGPTPAREYLRQMVFDLTVHAWDLARAVGADEEMPNDLVAEVLAMARDMTGDGSGSSMFAPAIRVAACDDDLTELLALTGRRR